MKNELKYILIFLSLLAAGCNSGSPKVNIKAVEQESNQAKLIEDSIEKAFMNGEYFMKEFIRLNDEEFIYMDDDYVKENIKDENVKDLYLNTKGLNKENRENFYHKIVSSLPKEDIEIHKLVWSLKEVKEQESGGDGGLYTLATWLVEKPTNTNPFYSFEIRRNYYWRFGICNPIGFVKVNSTTREIFINDPNLGCNLPLEEWRRIKG